jgi:hypothetical protein
MNLMNPINNRNAIDISDFARGLSAEDVSERNQFAKVIFLLGTRMARSTVDRWLSDPTLAKLLVTDESGAPSLTVGLAVEPASFEKIRTANGSPHLSEVPPDQDAKEFELQFPGNARLDILTTNDREGIGAIARYLQKFGEGIQQIEIRTKNVDQATEILRATFGIVSVYPATRAGADATRVNFFLVTTPEGRKILMELVEA